MKKLFLTILMFFSFICKGQISKTDSILISKTVTDFYSWYAKAASSNDIKEIRPLFIKDSKGMTTLDFNTYVDNLRKNNFSPTLIEKTIRAYDPCLKNLNKISFNDFNTYTDLDQFEEIKCDFNNHYEWTMDMEQIDGADVSKITRINEKDVIVDVLFFNIGTKDNKKRFWDYKIGRISLIKDAGNWKINDITVKFKKQ